MSAFPSAFFHAFHVTDAPYVPDEFQSPARSTLDVRRWMFGVCVVPQAQVSSRISDNFPDDQLRLRDASCRCTSAPSLARLPRRSRAPTGAHARNRVQCAGDWVQSLLPLQSRRTSSRSRLKLKLVLACSPYVSVVAAVSAAETCANAGGTPAATVKIREADYNLLSAERRSVSQKALLQNQFSK